MWNNEYFEKLYPTVITIVLVPVLISIVMIMYYLITGTEKAKKCTPHAFLIACFSFIIIVFWILIYIGAIYEHSSVIIESDE